MNQAITRAFACLSLVAILFSTTTAHTQNAPAEKLSAQIKRTATTPLPATAQLSKNLFRTEEYQANYTVQVPYQDTETYTVEVPYQVEETYTVQVPYQDTETYTENIPYTVEVPYTDYETDYRQEYQCQNVTRYRQECRTQRDCYIIPGTGGGQQCRQVEECGTNAQGQRICKTRTVCDGQNNPPQQRCEDKQVCSQVPYTDRECNYVNVPYRREVTRYRTETRYRQETRTRTVTRYRNETRTRTVTKTRTETRTREVTRYRNEERCCVTKTREVFDRQLQYSVVVNFPQDAVLVGNETEIVNLKLVAATATSAQVQVELGQTVFGYRIANQAVTGANIVVDLALAPKYDLKSGGVVTIQGLRADYVQSEQKYQISFNDSLQSRLIQSSYDIVISDLASGQQIDQLIVSRLASGKLGAVMNIQLDTQAKFKVSLRVQRQGVLIADQSISFEATLIHEKRMLQLDEVKMLSDKSLITTTLVGAGAESAIQIADALPEFADITTEYQVYVDIVNSDGTGTPLNKKVYSQDELKSLGMVAKLADVIKSPSKVAQALRRGQKLKYSVRLTRSGSALLKEPAKASKTETIVIR